MNFFREGGVAVKNQEIFLYLPVKRYKSISF